MSQKDGFFTIFLGIIREEITLSDWVYWYRKKRGFKRTISSLFSGLNNINGTHCREKENIIPDRSSSLYQSSERTNAHKA